MVKERGHKVLQLSPYQCTFNPIEMIWSQIKGSVSKNNTESKFTRGLLYGSARDEAKHICKTRNKTGNPGYRVFNLYNCQNFKNKTTIFYDNLK